MQSSAPTLLELQRALGRQLLGDGGEGAVTCIVGDGLDPRARLAIHRHTATGALVTALGLSYPAVRALVGAECFESAARLFIAQAPPRGAWLDEYGEAFPGFLARLPEVAPLAYLADIARLEWAVSSVLNAPDVPPLDLVRLAQREVASHGELCFAPHPAVRLLRSNYPVHAIWHAVLTRDDDALAVIDPSNGPVWLCVRRGGTGIEVDHFGEAQWHFTATLLAGQPLEIALASASLPEAQTWLAVLLAGGCFAAVRSLGQPDGPISEDPLS